MTTLILGCGYLGQRLVPHLLKASTDAVVFGTTRSTEKSETIASTGASPVIADVLDPDSLAALPPFDRLVHCLAMGRQASLSGEIPQFVGVDNLLRELARRFWTGRLVQVSSTSVYGQTDGSWVDEQSPTEPMGRAGKTSLEVENRLARGEAEIGFSRVTLRMAGIYGPERLVGRSTIERGEVLPGDPERWLNLIHVGDAARATRAALESDRPRPIYLVCDDRPVSRRSYYSALAAALGATEPRFDPDAGPPEANKRISNTLMRNDLQIVPEFPTTLDSLRIR